jgi:endonuclease/exonuclease/phosphatase family metal-dependent hydrolase
VIRSAWRAVSPNPSSDLSFERAIKVRVVTLNCGGNSRAAEEVALHDPDIVLLQESPSRDGVRKLTQKLFGANGRFIHEGDTAILTAGKVERRTPDGQNEFAHGRVQLALGPPIDVVSLRLSPPVSRLDFWSRGFWTEHHDCRAEHRSEINRLVKHLRQAVPKGPLILGGDFNTTPNDLILVRLKARLFDTFAASGQGWGNTGTNDYPLFRVDQIWASRDFAATVSAAHASEHSDHRMVVSEIQLRGSVAADRAMTRNDSN